MPITTFLEGDGPHFDPETKRVMGLAFKMTCAALRLRDSISTLVLTRSVAAGNDIGVQSGIKGTIWVAQSTVTGNNIGYIAEKILSYGDNYIDANQQYIGTLGSAPKR